MILHAYIFDISRATNAEALLTCRADAMEDACLDEEEKADVCRAIEKRFAMLNAGALQPQKPRWK